MALEIVSAAKLSRLSAEVSEIAEKLDQAAKLVRESGIEAVPVQIATVANTLLPNVDRRVSRILLDTESAVKAFQRGQDAAKSKGGKKK